MKDHLKRNIPEFQQNNDGLDGYLDAAGDFLQDAKEAIEHFDYNKDYQLGTDYNIDKSTLGRGLVLPRALPIASKRKILRDLADILLKVGTADGLQHALRLIGFNATVSEGWLPSPRNVRRGFLKDPVTGDVERYDVNKYVYTKLLYGKEVVTSSGVLFEGYRYLDTFKKNKISNLPIIGENYENYPAKDVAVAKTPYVIVKFTEGDFNVEVEDYVDPVTGETYQYSLDEEFALVNEVIRYFIVDTNRPTTIRVIIIVSLQELADTIVVSDEYSEEHTYVPDGGDDLTEELTVDDPISVDGTLTGISTNIGANIPIGIQTTINHQLSVVDPEEYPIGTIGIIEVNETTDWTSFSFNTTINLLEDIEYFPIRPFVEILFLAPAGTDVEVYGNSYDENDILIPTLIETVAAGDVFAHTTNENHHFISLVPVVNIDEEIVVNFSFTAFTQR